jgi:hypothetical protein
VRSDSGWEDSSEGYLSDVALRVVHWNDAYGNEDARVGKVADNAVATLKL